MTKWQPQLYVNKTGTLFMVEVSPIWKTGLWDPDNLKVWYWKAVGGSLNGMVSRATPTPAMVPGPMDSTTLWPRLQGIYHILSDSTCLRWCVPCAFNRLGQCSVRLEALDGVVYGKTSVYHVRRPLIWMTFWGTSILPGHPEYLSLSTHQV